VKASTRPVSLRCHGKMIKVPPLNVAVTRSMAAFAATLETDWRKRVATSKAKAPASKKSGSTARTAPAKGRAVAKPAKKVPAAKSAAKPAPAKKATAKVAPKTVVKKAVAKATSKPAAKTVTKATAKPAKAPAAKATPKLPVKKAAAKPAKAPAAKAVVKPAVAKANVAKTKAAKPLPAKAAATKGPAAKKPLPAKAAATKAPAAKAVPLKTAATKAPAAKAVPPKAVAPTAQSAKPQAVPAKAAVAKPAAVAQATKASTAKPVVVAAKTPATNDKKLKSEPVRKAPARPEAKPVSIVRKVINLDEIKLPEGYRPSPGEEYMCAQHLAYFKQKLENWRQDLINESQETLEHLRTETRDVGDEAERASRESDNILELRTRDRYRKLLSKIEQALKRIDDGSYGYCEETGEDIGLGRLEARPIATLTVDAQERRELLQRQFRDDH